jgi:hypothetical protein
MPGRPRNHGPIHGRRHRFFSAVNVQTGPADHTACYSIGNGSFSLGLSGRGMDLTTQLYAVWEMRMTGAVQPFRYMSTVRTYTQLHLSSHIILSKRDKFEAVSLYTAMLSIFKCPPQRKILQRLAKISRLMVMFELKTRRINENHK